MKKNYIIIIIIYYSLGNPNQLSVTPTNYLHAFFYNRQFEW